MSIVNACFRTLLSIAVFGGVAWWLVSSDSMFALVSESERPKAAELPLTSISDVDCAAGGDTLLSLVRGTPPNDSPLMLHKMEDEFHARPVPTSGYNVWKAALVPDASAVIVYDESRRVSRIELSVNVRVPLMAVPRQTPLSDLAVSPDGRIVAVALESEIVFCDAIKGGELLRIPIGVETYSQITFSDDSQRLAAGSSDGCLRIWNLGERAPLHVLPAHHRVISQVRFFDGGRKIASVGAIDDVLRIFDVATGKPLWQFAAGQNGLLSLAVSPDSRIVATGGLDKRIRLWDLREGAPMGAISAHAGVVKVLHFTKDGKTLISAADGTIRFWERDFAVSCRGIDLESIRPLAP